MTNLPSDEMAWLEDPQRNRIPIRESCSIGRSDSNQVALSSEMVSRHHAVIQVQRQKEFWLVDFGSSNGTYLNSQRLSRPTRLRSGDRVKIGPVEFVFCLAEEEGRTHSETAIAARTVTNIRHAKCWLLVADIIGSTRLVKELPPEEVPRVIGSWVAECKQTIEECGGRINQFLGDGFFAYWHDQGKSTTTSMANALRVLRPLQDRALPAFRVATHYGEVVLGGVSLGEEERISGKEVHFAFRIEELAGKLDEPRLLSQTAWERLAPLMETREIGSYLLQGFPSKVPMYAY
jgi:class 3 adenylate cyclase